jgi:hypothetical protein
MSSKTGRLVAFLSDTLFYPLRSLGLVSSTDDGQKVEVVSPAHALALTESYQQNSSDTLTLFVEQDNQELIDAVIPVKVLPDYYQPVFAISETLDEYPSWALHYEAQSDENDDDIDDDINIKIDGEIEIPTSTIFKIEPESDEEFMDMFNRFYKTEGTPIVLIPELTDGNRVII